jgi:hypothetical protein
VKADGKQNNQLAGISDYIGNRTEMDEWNSVPAGIFPGLYFDPEDEGDMFFRNVFWISADYTTLYPRR